MLNVKIEQRLKDKNIYYSNNLASISHQICYDLCFHSGIKKSRFFTKHLMENSFKIAVNSYVRKNSDTFNKIYDTILCKNYGWNVLKTFEHKEKEFLSFHEIISNIPALKRPEAFGLEEYLELLGSSEYKEIVRFHKSSQKYSISSPFFKVLLKMKFALEKEEQKTTINKKKKKRNNDYNIEEEKIISRNIIFDDEFLISFNEALEKILLHEIKSRKNK